MDNLKKMLKKFYYGPDVRMVVLKVDIKTELDPFSYEMEIKEADKWANQCMKNGLYVHKLKTWFPPHMVNKIVWSEKV